MRFKKLRELFNGVKEELSIIDEADRVYISNWQDGYYDGASAAYRSILVGLEEVVGEMIQIYENNEFRIYGYDDDEGLYYVWPKDDRLDPYYTDKEHVQRLIEEGEQSE